MHDGPITGWGDRRVPDNTALLPGRFPLSGKFQMEADGSYNKFLSWCIGYWWYWALRCTHIPAWKIYLFERGARWVSSEESSIGYTNECAGLLAVKRAHCLTDCPALCGMKPYTEMRTSRAVYEWFNDFWFQPSWINQVILWIFLQMDNNRISVLVARLFMISLYILRSWRMLFNRWFKLFTA